MSIALMTLAWKADYHSGKKMVLLALCDNANDQGECFPSVPMLAQKCSMSERSVFNRAYVDQLLASPEGYMTPLQGSKLWHLALLEFWLQVNVDGPARSGIH